jgi:hypothetical protein
MTTKPRGELFYVDENGKRQDRELHAEILGNDAPTAEDWAGGYWPKQPVAPPKEPGGKPDKP